MVVSATMVVAMGARVVVPAIVVEMVSASVVMAVMVIDDVMRATGGSFSVVTVSIALVTRVVPNGAVAGLVTSLGGQSFDILASVSVDGASGISICVIGLFAVAAVDLSFFRLAHVASTIAASAIAV